MKVQFLLSVVPWSTTLQSPLQLGLCILIGKIQAEERSFKTEFSQKIHNDNIDYTIIM